MSIWSFSASSFDQLLRSGISLYYIKSSKKNEHSHQIMAKLTYWSPGKRESRYKATYGSSLTTIIWFISSSNESWNFEKKKKKKIKPHLQMYWQLQCQKWNLGLAIILWSDFSLDLTLESMHPIWYKDYLKLTVNI